ncbi:PilC/PilY family type IV pilus protein [Rheinheimera texasensis]|uniref:pilus assembly protein n=1 Tax=Rheinheimera texasensis TaxID=306205 RepID=UPI0032B13B73
MAKKNWHWQSALCGALLASGTVQAAIDIASAPLETGSTVDPNIMFLLDDSGSMQQGMMPENLEDNANIQSNCSNQSYAGMSMCLFNTSGRAFLASSHVNKMYYNPTVTYTAPVKADGTSYGNASFTAAKVDGYKSTSTQINLSTGYRAIMSASDNGSSTGAKEDFAISPGNTAGAAFYYTFNTGCSNGIYSDSCYTQKSLSTTAEKTNFANWYSYYRTRILAAKAGISAAFHQQGTAMRVGYGSINSIGAMVGVSTFSGTSRTAFFNWLFGVQASGGTPLLGALNQAGTYYKTKNPWRVDPANTSSALLECRQNFTILMTDGYYSDSSTIGEQDNSASTTITGPKGRSYTYTPKSPFASSYSNTLADVAMHYWKNDLDAGWSASERLENTVPTSSANPAFWQHMVTFGVGFGVQGSINPTTAFNAISNNGTINWPTTSTDAGKIDDLLHASVNGRGGFFAASDPNAFSQGMADTLSSISERIGTSSNIAATAINSLQSESNLYQARYVAGEWSGDLWAYDTDDTTTPIWKASDVIPAHGSRNLLYGADTGAAKSFVWSNLSTAEKTALSNVSTVLDYIRGDTTLEKRNPGGLYRNRGKILGDLVNSSPELVEAPYDLSYHRYNWTGATTYRSFIEGPAKSRTPMLYVGSNDGMLHGFNADTGVEVFAYIPKAVMAPLPSDTVNVLKKYSEPNYSHKFSVDGSPVVVDVYISGSWKSLLIGGQGRGGNSMFVIDVTDPGSITPSKVLWDKSFSELGAYLGTPQVTRTESGQWVIIAGYGYNNSTNQSGLLVIDIATGNIVKQLATGQGSAGDPNGMAEVNLLDVDADGNTDWVYGGDMFGYVWKFDLSAASTSAWNIAYSGQPLFQAKNGSGTRQMITGGVLSSVEPTTGKVWLFFGTGRYLNVNDPSNNDQQTWYGLMDGATISGRAELESRTITNVGDQRVVTEVNNITAGKKGWYMDLIDTRERIVDMPLMVGPELVMNTTIPDTNVCNPSGSGYLMVVSPYTGGRLKKTFFDIDNNSEFDEDDKVSVSGNPTIVSGIKVSSLNSVTRLAKVGELIKSFNNCEGGCIESRAIDPTRNVGMQSWRELTN